MLGTYPTPGRYTYSPVSAEHAQSDYLLQQRLLCMKNEDRHCSKPYYSMSRSPWTRPRLPARRRSNLPEGQYAEHQSHTVAVRTKGRFNRYVAPTPYNERHSHPLMTVIQLYLFLAGMTLCPLVA